MLTNFDIPALKEDFALAVNHLKAMVNKVEASQQSTDRVTLHSLASIKSDEVGEVLNFFIDLLKEVADSVTVLINADDVSACANKLSRLNVQVEIKQDDTVWLYGISTTNNHLDNEANEPTYSINGVENAELSGNAWRINQAFKILSLRMAVNAIQEHLVKAADKHPSTVAKAKSIAAIMGGQYKDYLVLVDNFGAYMDVLSNNAEKPIAKEDIAYEVCKATLPSNDFQLREVAKLFQEQPLFH